MFIALIFVVVCLFAIFDFVFGWERDHSRIETTEKEVYKLQSQTIEIIWSIVLVINTPKPASKRLW